MALMGYLIWSGYQEAICTAETTTRNYVAIIEAQLDATLRRVSHPILFGARVFHRLPPLADFLNDIGAGVCFH
jgi:hypothetical protein